MEFVFLVQEATYDLMIRTMPSKPGGHHMIIICFRDLSCE